MQVRAIYSFLDNFDYLTDNEIDLVLKEQDPFDPLDDDPAAYVYDIKMHDSNQIIGWLDFQLATTVKAYYRGHVGFEIYLPYQGHNYAYKAVLLIKQLAKAHRFQSIIITCDPANIASIKTIEKTGAKFLEVAIVPSDNELYKYNIKERMVYELKI